MKSTFAILVTLIAAFAAASPGPQNRDNRGGNGGNNGGNRERDLVDMWADKNFLGLKFTGRGEYGRCENLNRQQENRVSSAKAHRGHRCTLYANKNCRGEGFTFIEARSFPREFDNKASSFRCDRV